MENLFQKIEESLINKTFENGLYSYEQENCRCTLTDNGYRIYRPPNITVENNGRTMWGGLKLEPYLQNNKDVLTKGHTYIARWHVSGQSSNGIASIGWSNNMGWSGGGLIPSPSNVSYCEIENNFIGEKDCFYKFTISDDIYKVCTEEYSNFKKGTAYLSYKHFMFGFYYYDTGPLGTDLYITNLRMYDITNENTKIAINKNTINCGEIIENNMCNVKIYKHNGEILGNNFLEV